MPSTLTYPGVYIEEVPSGVRTISGVATSVAAFVGRAYKGPENKPVTIFNWGDYERIFGGLWASSPLSYAVKDFFANGGGHAVIVRVTGASAAATVGKIKMGKSATATPVEFLIASSKGVWGKELTGVVDYDTKDPTGEELYNLTVNLVNSTTKEISASETFLNLSKVSTSGRYGKSVIESQSKLVTVKDAPAERPQVGALAFSGGHDGNELMPANLTGAMSAKTGIYALEDTDLFTLLCIPSFAPNTDTSALFTAALAYCKKRRAFMIVDPPTSWVDSATAVTGMTTPLISDENAAIYFPRIMAPDPLQENRMTKFSPCGAVAGVMARTDAERGVWKAPAGLDANLKGVNKVAYNLSDAENGQLNKLGLNCIRSFPGSGHVVWGARTTKGADRLASEWKYVPVRRLALFLEESLFRGTQWVVFEPNDEPLWAQIRLNLGAFMHTLFKQGAFKGMMPKDAYFVKCDKETTTQTDINMGVVNIHIGFAPLKPAEFVVIKIQQMAGQVEA